MASIIYFGKDTRIRAMLEPFFQERLKESGETHAILQVNDDKSFNESIEAMSFDVTFVEQTMLPATPNDWLVSIHKTKPLLKGPMILVGTEQNMTKIMKWIDGGWTDFISFPPDKSILIEKVWMYASGKRSSDLRQVYSIAMSGEVNLARVSQFEELSEFDCKVRTTSAIPVGDTMLLFSSAFSIEPSGMGTALGRCYQSIPHVSQKDAFMTSFYFLGLTSETMTVIRNSLRKQFISGKSK